MSGNKLLDTNILIHLSRKDLSLDSILMPGDKIYISVITYMEVLGFLFKNKVEEKIIAQLCNSIPMLTLSNEIVNHVIYIRKKKKIKLPDAIIFSTAKIHGSHLITANENDFKGLNENVKIINPLR